MAGLAASLLSKIAVNGGFFRKFWIMGGSFMDLHNIIDISLKVSSKIDTYWTVLIVITASVIAVPLQNASQGRWLLFLTIVGFYSIFLHIDWWALKKAYEALIAINHEIKSKAHSEKITKEFSDYLNNIPEILLGKWNGITHLVAFFSVSFISYIKIFMLHDDTVNLLPIILILVVVAVLSCLWFRTSIIHSLHSLVCQIRQQK